MASGECVGKAVDSGKELLKGFLTVAEDFSFRVFPAKSGQGSGGQEEGGGYKNCFSFVRRKTPARCEHYRSLAAVSAVVSAERPLKRVDSPSFL